MEERSTKSAVASAENRLQAEASPRAKKGLQVLAIRDGSSKGKGRFCVCIAVTSPEIEELLRSL
jgi:hypothetical protein